MSIISSQERKALKNQLTEYYTKALYNSLGSNTRKSVEEMVNLFDKETAKLNGYNLPDNWGNLVFDSMASDNNSMVCKALADGATKEDIINYFNINQLVKSMYEWYDNLCRYSTYRSMIETNNLSEDDAMKYVRSIFPMYGDPTDTKNVQGNDRPLTPVLKARVCKYINTYGADRIAKETKMFSTYNAYIRHKIAEELL